MNLLLGEDKNTRLKDIILRTGKHNLEETRTKEYMLQKIPRSRKSPPLYNVSYGKALSYFISKKNKNGQVSSLLFELDINNNKINLNFL